MDAQLGKAEVDFPKEKANTTIAELRVADDASPFDRNMLGSGVKGVRSFKLG
jgi:hypothetical protein